ncbi:DUF2202 domain-containing protein [Mycoplasmatota bacterium WC30]
MKKNIIKGFVIAFLAVTAVLTVSLTSVSAKSVYSEYSNETVNLEFDDEVTYTLEEMLTYAILDEYLAQAEYLAIIEEFGEISPFVNIVKAEANHIELLLPLFEAYGIELPENTASLNTLLPESITSALSTGIAAEEANIDMYIAFLAQDNLPDDVRLVFEQLVNASINHLAAFSKDRYSYIGEDFINKIKNQYKKQSGEKNALCDEQGNSVQNQNSGPQGNGNNGGQGRNGGQGGSGNGGK